ncbi:MAG: Gfo/Idh/MocA family oxidoreductase, partial [Clostridiaceae bacterium]|nr:Gfo/Idh/MocA family oxidoreductase [Clostridiaceae bacterium]
MVNASGKIRVGIVGMGRTAAFMRPVIAHPHATLAAVCDLDEDLCRAALDRYGVGSPQPAIYTVYENMLQSGRLDAVIIGTPVYAHVPQSILALAENIHVFSEVPATWSLDEAKALVHACRTSQATYMMGENSCYDRSIMTVRNMIADGVFGHIHYAEGEYIHECLSLLAKTPWREKLFALNGLVYTTHEIGPIMSLIGWDRIARLSAIGSGSHFAGKAGQPYVQETRLVMQGQTAQGRLVRVCQDFQSPGTHSHHRYVIQGVNGRFESGYRDFPAQVMAPSIQDEKGSMVWKNLSEFEARYLPDIWKRSEAEAKKHGHGGSDYVLINDYL